MIDGLRNVGPDSLYLRFFSNKAGFTDEELRQATEVDFSDVVALVAVLQEGSAERLVGGCRYLRIGSSGPTQRAEVAFLIDDAHQGLGIGSHLFKHLVAIARAAGIAQLEADVLPANRGMLGLFSRSGFPVTKTATPEAVHLTIDLTAGGAAIDAAHRMRSQD
ncbi:MAG: GNAT family N-acetyltransferase [Gammaproteobacteria bacterium]|nr:GNAT family N-acetyltransferase [Gammaproteobacteria bacterium]